MNTIKPYFTRALGFGLVIGVLLFFISLIGGFVKVGGSGLLPVMFFGFLIAFLIEGVHYYYDNIYVRNRYQDILHHPNFDYLKEEEAFALFEDKALEGHKGGYYSMVYWSPFKPKGFGLACLNVELFFDPSMKYDITLMTDKSANRNIKVGDKSIIVYESVLFDIPDKQEIEKMFEKGVQFLEKYERYF